MKLTVTGRKIEITDGIRDHLNNKINKTNPMPQKINTGIEKL